MLQNVLIMILMILLTSCSAGVNYSNECLWYTPVKLSDKTKELLRGAEPWSEVINDLHKIVYNNEMFDEVC